MTDSRGLTLHVAPLVLHTTLGSVPAALSNNQSPTATSTGDPPEAMFECSLDGGTWTACTSPWSPAAPVACSSAAAGPAASPPAARSAGG